MLFAKNAITSARVSVCRNISVIRTLAAVPNAYKTPNVIVQKPASITDAKIPAPAYVASMQVSFQARISHALNKREMQQNYHFNHFLYPFPHEKQKVCVVQNHAPNCFCDTGYTGDPSTACKLFEPGEFACAINEARMRSKCSRHFSLSVKKSQFSFRREHHIFSFAS